MEKKHSYHIFLFPFRLENKDSDNPKKGKSDLFKDLKALFQPEDWQNEDFDNDNFRYNHVKYFYDFDILQDGYSNTTEKNIVLHKRFKGLIDATYTIEIIKKVKEIVPEPLLKDTFPESHPSKFDVVSFELKIDKICLDIYPNEVGILSFHLINDKHKDAEDILLINQYGRRIYAPFKDTRFKDFEKKWSITDELTGTKYRELANKISIRFKDKEDKAKEYPEDFLKNNSNKIFSIPVHFSFLLKENDDIEIKPLLDDRMFVMCWYGCFQLGNDFKRRKIKPKIEREKFKYCISEITQRAHGGYEVTSAYRNSNQHRALSLNTSFDGYGYATNDFWYQYVFIDSTFPSCANELMHKRQLMDHTYDRWVENNTLYGISRFSFVCITEPFSSLCSPAINAAFIPEHFKTIYFRMVTLALAQRVSILGFSKMISLLSFEELKENQNKERDKFLNIYEEYRRFINEIYHREVTAQEQGIELYDMLQDQLRIKEHAKELEKEFIEMNRLVDLIGTNETNKRMRVLTVMGSAFAIFSILFGLQNSDYFKDILEFNFINLFNQPFCFDCAYPILMISALAYFLINGLLLWYKKKKNRLYFMVLSLFIFIIYLITYKLQPASWKLLFSIIIILLSITATWKITFFYSKKT